jgi:hypothetical protein
MLGLVWDDVDLAAGVFHIRAQLSRAHRGAPARRGAPKTPASVRDVPLVPQLARLLSAKVDRRRARSRLNAGAARSIVRPTARRSNFGEGVDRPVDECEQVILAVALLPEIEGDADGCEQR